jgi:hypothetical protein
MMCLFKHFYSNEVSKAYCVNTYLVQFNLLCRFLFIVRFELQYIASVYSLIFYKYFVIGHKRHLIQRPFIFIVVWRTIWREITLIVITPICMYNVYFREMEITFLPGSVPMVWAWISLTEEQKLQKKLSANNLILTMMG